jgi:carboxyl-terminal processing protease
MIRLTQSLVKIFFMEIPYTDKKQILLRMKKAFKLIILFISVHFIFQSCETQSDNEVPANLKIQDFVWKGLNLYYLWQADAPNLSDDRFNNQKELNQFLSNYSDPTILFNELRIDHSIDRFSVIFSDYRILEGILQGTTKNDGVDYGLRYKSGSTTEIFGWVRYILPNSDASNKNIHRGDLFYAINGIPLTIDNYRTLLANDSYTLNLANYDNGNITPNGTSVSLTKSTYSENPVFISNVINSGTHKIGYLMYNGFYPNFDAQLNTAFGQFSGQGITDLVLDLRYNSGGSVATATRLASMITGQFNGQLFAKEQWNAKIQDYYNASNPSNLQNNFTNTLGNNTPINSLNLSKIYILTSKSSASASELLINGLRPYINVVQIGDVTTGKNVGSITLYDSPTFGKNDRATSHYYAMQPIVLKVVNKAGFGDYQTGLVPDYELLEDLENLAPLGDINEPLLSTAIGQITANGRMMKRSPEKMFNPFKDVKSINGLQDEMYLEEIPEGLLNVFSKTAQ